MLVDILTIKKGGIHMNTKMMEQFETMDAETLSHVAGGGLYDGANGYAYRDSQGHWAYKVTKTPAQALTDVVVNSWASGAASFAAYA